MCLFVRGAGKEQGMSIHFQGQITLSISKVKLLYPFFRTIYNNDFVIPPKYPECQLGFPTTNIVSQKNLEIAFDTISILNIKNQNLWATTKLYG